MTTATKTRRPRRLGGTAVLATAAVVGGVAGGTGVLGAELAAPRPTTPPSYAGTAVRVGAFECGISAFAFGGSVLTAIAASPAPPFNGLLWIATVGAGVNTAKACEDDFYQEFARDLACSRPQLKSISEDGRTKIYNGPICGVGGGGGGGGGGSW